MPVASPRCSLHLRPVGVPQKSWAQVPQQLLLATVMAGSTSALNLGLGPGRACQVEMAEDNAPAPATPECDSG